MAQQTPEAALAALDCRPGTLTGGAREERRRLHAASPALLPLVVASGLTSIIALQALLGMVTR